MLTSPDDPRRRRGGDEENDAAEFCGGVRAPNATESREVLKFTGGHVLLVRRFIDCVEVGRSRDLLVSPASVLRPHHCFCRRDRFSGHLAGESLVSLRDHCTRVAHRCDSLPGWQSGYRSREREFGVFTRLRRNRRRVRVGMEIREAFRLSRLITTRRPALIRPQPSSFPWPVQWLLRCSSSSDHLKPQDLSLESRAKPPIAFPISRSVR